MRTPEVFGRLMRKVQTVGWLSYPFLAVVSALVYLPRVAQLTFQKDDWYFIYRLQACRILSAMGSQGYPLKADMLGLVNQAFCRAGQ